MHYVRGEEIRKSKDNKKNMRKNWQNCKDSLHIKRKEAEIIINRKGKSHVAMRKLQIPEKIICIKFPIRLSAKTK